MNFKDIKITVIGLGYVGLPLAVEFAKKYIVFGFDINHKRIDDLRKGIDSTLEVENKDLLTVLANTPLNGFFPTTDIDDIASSNIFIITVPTPVDENNKPILTPLIKASEIVGSILKEGDIVIYESTVYPGCTEDDCVPVLEKASGLDFNSDFFCGYSPERINPGDKQHTLTRIRKVTSGSNNETAQFVDDLYGSIIEAGTHKATSIRVAEAAKVIENSQRDINIAFVNELAKIFNLLDIDTHDVLAAAGSKWNFLPFKPGIVGGHCIGVDPFYLAQKAQEAGYYPEIILSGRKMNDSMGDYIASDVAKEMQKKNIQLEGANVLLLGITFKENCPDIRNTKVMDIYKSLRLLNADVEIFDSWADNREVKEEFGVTLMNNLEDKKYDAIILAVAHNEFLEMDLSKLKKPSSIVYDVKGVLNKKDIDKRL